MPTHGVGEGHKQSPASSRSSLGTPFVSREVGWNCAGQQELQLLSSWLPLPVSCVSPCTHKALLFQPRNCQGSAGQHPTSLTAVGTPCVPSHTHTGTDASSLCQGPTRRAPKKSHWLQAVPQGTRGECLEGWEWMDISTGCELRNSSWHSDREENLCND